MNGIVNTPNSRAIYAQTWVSFAYGRQPNPQDQCVANQLNTSLGTSGYTIVQLLADLTQSDTFSTRVQATP
jgi:hypothetical protein